MPLSIFHAAEEAGEALALWTPERAYSFAQLAALVRAHEDPPGEAFCAEPGLPSILTILKRLAAGRRFCPLHPRLAAGQRAALEARLEAERSASQIANSGRRIGATGLADPKGDSAEALVMFTSGSSGRPKGVVLSCGALIASAKASAAVLGWRPEDRWLLSIPLAHIGGLSILSRALIARRAVVLPPPGRFEAARIGRLMEEAEVSLASLVPTQLRRLLEAGWRPQARLRAVLLGGAPAEAQLLERARAEGVPVLTTYGLTESCAQVSLQTPGTTPSPALGAGRALPGIGIRARGGAIQLSGPTLLSRYLDGPPPAWTEDGWLDTGDRGRLDAAGQLFVFGRAGELILSGGENIYPAEVEPALLSDPAVAEAMVFGQPSAQWGEEVCAAVVWAGAPDEAGLKERLGGRLAKFQRPRQLASLEALPKTGSGKLDRARARAEAAGRLRPL